MKNRKLFFTLALVIASFHSAYAGEDKTSSSQVLEVIGNPGDLSLGSLALSKTNASKKAQTIFKIDSKTGEILEVAHSYKVGDNYTSRTESGDKFLFRAEGVAGLHMVAFDTLKVGGNVYAGKEKLPVMFGISKTLSSGCMACEARPEEKNKSWFVGSSEGVEYRAGIGLNNKLNHAEMGSLYGIYKKYNGKSSLSDVKAQTIGAGISTGGTLYVAVSGGVTKWKDTLTNKKGTMPSVAVEVGVKIGDGNRSSSHASR